jgi:hypothetical protein
MLDVGAMTSVLPAWRQHSGGAIPQHAVWRRYGGAGNQTNPLAGQ